MQESDSESNEIREKQQKDPELIEIMDYIQNDILPCNDKKAWKILLGSGGFISISERGLLHHLDRG